MSTEQEENNNLLDEIIWMKDTFKEEIDALKVEIAEIRKLIRTQNE